jgi:hypothetical protein
MADQPEVGAERIEIEVRWVGLDEVPIIAANQLIAQVNQGEVFLTFGQVAPPPLLGTAEQQRQQMRRIAESGGPVSIRTVGRFHMTPARLKEMIGVLNEVMAKHEAQVRAGSEGLP